MKQGRKGRDPLSERWKKIKRARAFTVFALANLYLVRYELLPPGAKCVL